MTLTLQCKTRMHKWRKNNSFLLDPNAKKCQCSPNLYLSLYPAPKLGATGHQNPLDWSCWWGMSCLHAQILLQQHNKCICFLEQLHYACCCNHTALSPTSLYRTTAFVICVVVGGVVFNFSISVSFLFLISSLSLH